MPTPCPKGQPRKAPARLVEGAVTQGWKAALGELALVYPDRIKPLPVTQITYTDNLTTSACVVITKQQAKYTEPKFDQLHALAQRQGLSQDAFHELDELAPLQDGEPLVIGPGTPDWRKDTPIPGVRQVGFRKVGNHFVPIVHAKIALLGRMEWTDEHPSGHVVDDFPTIFLRLGRSVITPPFPLGPVVILHVRACCAALDGPAYEFPYIKPNSAYRPRHIVTVPDAPELNPGTADWSVTSRFRFTHSFGNMLQKGQGGKTYFKMQAPRGVVSCLFRGADGSKSVNSGVPLNEGEWHTVRARDPATRSR